MRWPGGFVRTVRSSCSECGAGDLLWLSADEARVDGIPVDEAEMFLGSVESVWRCPSCGEVGFFGSTEGL
jgi:uncharacterized protein with PIN domain